MTTSKLHVHPARSRPPAKKGLARRPARTTVKRQQPVGGSSAVLDAVRDQHDQLWIRFGTHERACWTTISDLARPGVVAGLARFDPRLIEAKAQRNLLSEIARTSAYRPALVAAAPGWIENHFVFGDGAVLSPCGVQAEVIVTFEPHAKFAPHGTLDDWQARVGPVVSGQSLVLFTFALAFVGPLMRFVPPDYLSPMFELVGGPGCGKSTLGIAAASVWAGDRDSSCGGGETWNLTPGRFDAVKLDHRHILLLLDDGSIAGASLKSRRELISHAVFSFADTGSRQRLGDPPPKAHAQLAVLSTSNRRLADLIEGSSDERGAILERMITIPVTTARMHGVLDQVPPGFTDAAKAIEALRGAAGEQWGTAGATFVEELQREAANNEESLRGVVARALAREREKLSALTDRPRVQKSFALVTIAGMLARHWGILLPGWGCPGAAVRAVARKAIGEERSADHGPAARMRAYVEQHRARLCHVTKMHHPLSEDAFEDAAGFLMQHKGRAALIVPSKNFHSYFRDYRQIVSDLRRQGRADTEGGKKPKLTIKTPKALCASGRVYCVYLD